jgi:hypothetical protein
VSGENELDFLYEILENAFEQTKEYVKSKDFVMKDNPCEKEIDFQTKVILARAAIDPLYKGTSLHDALGVLGATISDLIRQAAVSDPALKKNIPSILNGIKSTCERALHDCFSK